MFSGGNISPFLRFQNKMILLSHYGILAGFMTDQIKLLSKYFLALVDGRVTKRNDHLSH
jgi:hypothetical protein